MLNWSSHFATFGKTSYVSLSVPVEKIDYGAQKSCVFTLLWLLINKTVCLHSLNVEKLVMNNQLWHNIDASALLYMCGLIFMCSSCHSNRLNMKLSHYEISILQFRSQRIRKWQSRVLHWLLSGFLLIWWNMSCVFLFLSAPFVFRRFEGSVAGSHRLNEQWHVPPGSWKWYLAEPTLCRLCKMLIRPRLLSLNEFVSSVQSEFGACAALLQHENTI